MSQIHQTAIIAEGAELHPSVEVGPYAVVGPHVKIGEGTRIGPHAVVEGRTTIGRDNRIFQFASVGAIPQDLKYAGEPTELVIGDGNQFREFTTVHLGTVGGGGVTRIGNRNLFMANSHVAHDCVIGDGCVMANSVALAGHVEVDSHVILGGLSAIHQFTRIGAYAFVSGGAMVAMDVPPYCTVQGDRAELAGLNTVGLTRHGFTSEQVRRVKDAYRILFRAKLGLNEALSKVRAQFGGAPEIERLLTFIEASKRGITR
ncbi:MAG TPA: acyl-ACP--UDP-N-acetylglucosamine O-acyltransferase [Myxococcaceae bacterium]|nr:acyl-ACP--UDP-N-acetylglucosamine O-acyltransferase [Myxococcaceae bacterium]